MSEKQIRIIGWLATVMAVLMYVSYIAQIIDNLSGQKANIIQPMVATVNSILWICYGWLKKEKDIPLVAANIPGIIFGCLTVITSLM